MSPSSGVTASVVTASEISLNVFFAESTAVVATALVASNASSNTLGDVSSETDNVLSIFVILPCPSILDSGSSDEVWTDGVSTVSSVSTDGVSTVSSVSTDGVSRGSSVLTVSSDEVSTWEGGSTPEDFDSSIFSGSPPKIALKPSKMPPPFILSFFRSLYIRFLERRFPEVGL